MARISPGAPHADHIDPADAGSFILISLVASYETEW
jgi:hypothetical protein